MAINSYPDNSGGEVNFPDQLIDPVSKFRVSNPENLIDTDFEYGLQPTKWETVELINNTPSFFSKSGDTTIDGISSIITNAGTREIIVKTELDHGLAVGIPINVTGTKSITADGAYIINSIPDPQTFTYLCKDNQSDTNSILDLYSSIITGEFFQGSQLRISDSDGIVTDAEGTSILTVTTNTTHGFGENTPFYFLNLNSTVAQEFQAANTASKSFDASNSATAQTFDGSNSLSSVSIDWSNSATFGGTSSTISGTDQEADTITVTHQAGENFNNLPLGTPLYYNVNATGGYFNTNPRGVVFLKTINTLGTLTSTFQVSLTPNGNTLDLTSNLSGTFQIANQARTFAGNNIDPLTQNVIDTEVGINYNFDAGNQGYTGAVQGTPPNNTLTVLSYSETAINADGASSVDYYVGAMVRYATSGTAPTGLTANTTYFVTSFTNNSGGNYTFSVAALPGGTPISFTGAGSGTQTFARIGISLDKNIVHIPNSNFQADDMLEYTFPVDGRFSVSEPEQEKRFYFVETAYDAHNYTLSEDLGFKPMVATGGTILPEYQESGRTWKAHLFTSVGTTNFVVTDPGEDGLIEYLIVAGGGAGGSRIGGGGGAGGVREGFTTITAQTYPIVVGAGGVGANSSNGTNGGNSSAFSITALGGGGGGRTDSIAGLSGGSGGGGGRWGAGGVSAPGGSGTSGQGFSGGSGQIADTRPDKSGGGGGAGGRGFDWTAGGHGGIGIRSLITGTGTYYAGGGGGASWQGDPRGNGGLGGGGFGGGGNANEQGLAGVANTGGGGGGGGYNGEPGLPGLAGGSGVVVVRYPLTPAPAFVAPVATGGTVTETLEDGVFYRVHSFNNTGTSNFVVSSPGSWNEFEYLIVAGGGSGGAGHSGAGGGAGGLIQGRTPLTAQSYNIVVGAGGAGFTTSTGGERNNGQNSSAFGLTAIGGGAGGAELPGANPGVGGSGGGGSGVPTLSNRTGAAGTALQGNAGGNGNIAGKGDNYGSAGGGGGAGGPGQSAPAANRSGIGGDGLVSRITGSNVIYAAGGSGGNEGGIFVPGGSAGVGGSGGYGSAPGFAGRANTGSGGGGSTASSPRVAGAGGTGVVIIRYAIGIQEPGAFITATGGDVQIFDIAGEKYAAHIFTNQTGGTSTFQVTSVGSVSENNVADILVVAGGGATGRWYGGGGGAGGMLEFTNQTLTATSYPVIVGAGGIGIIGSGTGQAAGNDGGNSRFGNLTNVIGGGGGGGTLGASGRNGGSGGGAAYSTGAGSGTVNQGNGGGGIGSAAYGGGGGGGAAGAGGALYNDGTIRGGPGGAGRISTIIPASIASAIRVGEVSAGSVYYAGGGQGQGQESPAFRGGIGGGGDADRPGDPNTGGGGGGGFGSSGGSGIVIVRYKIGLV
jgi:hypothetical protein